MTSTDDPTGPAGKRTSVPRAKTIDLDAADVREVAADPAAPTVADAPAARAAETDGTATGGGPAPEAAPEAARAEPPRGEPHAAPASRSPLGAVAAGLAGAVIALAAAYGAVSTGMLPLAGPAATTTTGADVGAQIAALDAKIAALESAGPPPAAPTAETADLTPLKGELAALSARLDALAAADSTGAAPADDALVGRVAALEEAQAALADRPAADPSALETGLAALSSRLDAVDTALRDLPGETSATTGAVEAIGGRLDALQVEVGDTATKVGAATATLDTLATRIETLEGRLAAATGPSPAALAFAAAGLARAVDDGRPYAAELAVLAPHLGGGEALATLESSAESGVPTRAALAARFAAVETAIAQTAATPPADGSLLDTMIASARSIVAIRPSGPVDGDDPGAVATRIAAALATGDLPAALALWQGLPEAARAASADFGADLGRRVAVEAALVAASRDVGTALGAGTPAAPAPAEAGTPATE